MTTKVRAYVDLVSAYSYISIHRLDKIVGAHGYEVDWAVVSLPHVLKASGGISPLAQPLKAQHNEVDWERQCTRAGLLATLPETRPVDAGLARLLFHRVKRHHPDRTADLLKALSATVFGQGQSIATADDIAACLVGHGLADLTHDITVAARDHQAKADLKHAFDAAQADGMFGAPFVVIDEAAFWGASQLDAIDRHLSGKADLPAGFAEIPTLAGFPDGFGPVFRRIEDGQVILGLHVTSRHINPAGMAHGGLLATMADMAAGAQVAHELGARPGVPTVSLTLDFLSPVRVGQWLEVSARVLRQGARICFVEGRAVTADEHVLRFSGTLASPIRPISTDETA